MDTERIDCNFWKKKQKQKQKLIVVEANYRNSHSKDENLVFSQLLTNKNTISHRH